MKFELNGDKYEITFQHDSEHRYTHCQIKNSHGEALCEGIAVVHANDVNCYCKETGRKISLTDALRHHYFSKAERKVIWDSYMNRIKGEKVKHIKPVYRIKSTEAGAPPSFMDNMRNMWNWVRYTVASFI